MENIQQILPIVLMFAVLYLFFLRPQMTKQKKEKKFAEALKKGDKVVTKSGLHGKVFAFADKLDAVVIETNAGKLTFDKSAISLEMSQKLNPTTKDSESKS